MLRPGCHGDEPLSRPSFPTHYRRLADMAALNLWQMSYLVFARGLSLAKRNPYNDRPEKYTGVLALW